MLLAIRGAHCTVRTNWSDYALLRDNVQHYLENGAPSERFTALHGIERAVGPSELSALRRYLDVISRVPRLSRDEEIALGERIQAARGDVVRALASSELAFNTLTGRLCKGGESSILANDSVARLRLLRQLPVRWPLLEQVLPDLERRIGIGSRKASKRVHRARRSPCAHGTPWHSPDATAGDANHGRGRPGFAPHVDQCSRQLQLLTSFRMLSGVTSELRFRASLAHGNGSEPYEFVELAEKRIGRIDEVVRAPTRRADRACDGALAPASGNRSHHFVVGRVVARAEQKVRVAVPLEQ
jgi:hypothetical protein